MVIIMDYRDTLNLPHTDFSMRGNLTKKEPVFIERWKELYKLISQQKNKDNKYILHDGPPYANGKIHIGHTLNKILKDFVIKYKLLQGYNTPLVPGWDCHGLPVELKLLEKLKVKKDQVDQIEFRKQAKDFALKFVDIQKEDFVRLGVWADWEDPYLTLNHSYEAGVLKVLERLVDSGYVYRGLKPVNWCINCATALAEAEVEYKDKESDSVYIKFKLADKIFDDIQDDINIIVWTTTPWTLISNVGIAFHPDLEYILVDTDKGKYIFAQDLKDIVVEKIFKQQVKVLHRFKGSQLKGRKAIHPFLDRTSDIVTADYVSSQDGSGCVHIAPGHGQEDFLVGKEFNLPTVMPLDNKGYFTDVGEYSGLRVNKINDILINKMKDNHTLLLNEKITHSYPHCWRCKKSLIFRTTDQWFLNVEHNGLRDKLKESIEKVRWVPSQGKERMYSMVENRPDWCLSRQRLWGIPIPAVRCKECDKVILDKKIIANLLERVKTEGVDIWFAEKIESFLPSGFTCECGSSQFIKEKDILDVWFESGASFYSVLKQYEQLDFPCQLYLEGSDQHRGWFQVSLILSVALEGIPPFENVLTHGFVVDGHGKKMSKSQGNVISPQKIMNKYGAEILRLWVSFGDYSGDVSLSDDIVKQLIDAYRKIRNTVRFVLANISDFDPKLDKVPIKELEEIDRLILSKTANVLKEIERNYEDFLFYKVYQTIYEFCNITLSSFYLDILKDRLYTFAPNSKGRKSAQTVLWYVLNFLIKTISPIASFTGEEAYSHFIQEDKKDSVFFSSWPDYKDFQDTELEKKWEKVFNIRERVLKKLEEKRGQGDIGSSLAAKVVLSIPDQKDVELFTDIQDSLREVFIVSSVEVNEGKEFSIEIEQAQGEKCPRCWNYTIEIGKDKEFTEVCSRCAKALKEKNKHKEETKDA